MVSNKVGVIAWVYPRVETMEVTGDLPEMSHQSITEHSEKQHKKTLTSAGTV